MKPEIESDVSLSDRCILTEDVASLIVIIMLHEILNLN